MEYRDEDFIMLSALQHFLFCPRQCYLIHVEQIWEENYLTMKGKFLHEKAHSTIAEKRQGFYTVHGLRLVSKKYGLTGAADIVEFMLSDAGNIGRVCLLKNKNGWWVPLPVEYKKGNSREQDPNNVQLCAQCLCLEEMLGISINEGVIYHGDDRSRETVIFDNVLRQLTEETIYKTHELISKGTIPAVSKSKRCKSCSLADICMPGISDRKSNKYINSIFEAENEKTS